MMTRRCLMTLVVSALFFLLLIPAAGGRHAVAQNDVTSLSASMNSFYYVPGDQAYLDVDLKLSDEAREGDIRLEFLVYSSANTRSSLASFRENTRRLSLIHI